MGGLAIVAGLLVALSRSTAITVAGTSPMTLVAGMATAGVLVATHRTIDAGWVTWRRALALLALVAVSYPALWAAAV